MFDLDKVINDPDATLEEQAAAHVGTWISPERDIVSARASPSSTCWDEGYEFNNDPAPDLLDISPDGRMIVVSFRGSNPITVKHAALGSCPGLGVVTLTGDEGTTGTLTHVFRTFVPDATGTRNLSDIHAAVVRIKSKD